MIIYQAGEGSKAFKNDQISPFLGGFLQDLVFQKIPLSSPLNSVQALLCPSSHPELCLLPELLASAICWWRAELAWHGVGWESCTHWKALGRGASEPRKLIPEHICGTSPRPEGFCLVFLCGDLMTRDTLSVFPGKWVRTFSSQNC